MKTLLVLLLITFGHNANSCDVCGGAVGNVSSDAIPGIFNNYFGINSSLRGFSSTHLTLFDSEDAINSTELYSFTSIHGRYSPIRRLQFLLHVPYSSVSKKMNGSSSSLSGFSDVTLRTNYLLIDRSNDSLAKYWNLFLGSSIKTPTGRSRFNEGEANFFHRNMLPGSGTLDVGLHADLYFRKANNGFIFNSSVIFRGTLKDEYDYGNFMQCSLFGFHFVEFKKSLLLLNAGLSFAQIEKDGNLVLQELDRFTGGWSLSPGLRLNYFWNKIILTSELQRPILQEYAAGKVTNQFTIQAGIIYQFKKEKS